MIAASTKRPFSVLLVASAYLAIGVVGFAAHFRELLQAHNDAPWIELTEFLAIVAGAFLLRRHNWARWLATVWIGFHVVLSAFHSVREMAIHALLLAVIAWLLFRPAASRYFQGAGSQLT
jgi:hypothetical protein